MLKASENQVRNLLERGVTEVIEREHLKKALSSGKQLRVKLGIDPTASDLHLGHAVVLKKLAEFQNLGHKAILVIGDFTATIGDPTGNNKTRPTLTKKEVKKNFKTYLKQASKIINVRKAEIVYNSKWLSKLSVALLLELMAQVSVQNLIERDDFKNRITSGESLRMHELLYPLLQGYDSVIVRADVELGGNDQLFNNLSGRTIMQKLGMPGQDVLTTELLLGIDGGKKMSKSLGNYIALNDEPKEMFAKIMAIKDEMIKKYFILTTDLSEEEIEKILSQNNPKDQKVLLAKEVVSFYYSPSEAEAAKEEFKKIFSQKENPSEVVTIGSCDPEMLVLDLLMKMEGIESKNEARRLLDQGGVKINGEQISNPNLKVKIEGEVLIQVGKRRFAKFSQ